MSGLWLGLAGALALMTKYWVLTMIGAVGLAALIHPERLQFLRSPAPWVAIATLVVAMLPHLWWLKQVDFVPLTYAGDVYGAAEPRAERCSSCSVTSATISRCLLLPVALRDRAGAGAAPWRSTMACDRLTPLRAHGRAAPIRA